ncbi:TPA: phage tail protein [Yersinia enterocolitica]|nr:phage tail protein [Yersinia enterocolitica]
MSYALPNGAHVYIASEYEEAINFTAITNADNAVITVENAGNLAVGDIVHITSAWTGIDGVIARIKAVADTALTLENINTLNTGKYAAGAGAGSIKKVKSWLEIPQITDISTSGGEQQTVQIQFLSDDAQRNLNTFKSARSQSYTIAHDSTLPVYEVLARLDESGEVVACYMHVPKAAENRYWSVSVSFNPIPATAVNTVETVDILFNMQSPAMTFYKVAA